MFLPTRYILKNEFPANGVDALETKCPFDQVNTLQRNIAYVRNVLGIKDVHINVVGAEGCYEAKKEAGLAKPGAPSVKFV